MGKRMSKTNNKVMSEIVPTEIFYFNVVVDNKDFFILSKLILE